MRWRWRQFWKGGGEAARTRGKPAFRPSLEQLETREAAAAFQPTALEQAFLERINDVRANPAAFGLSAPPSQPLAFDPKTTKVIHRVGNYFATPGYLKSLLYSAKFTLLPGASTSFPWLLQVDPSRFTRTDVYPPASVVYPPRFTPSDPAASQPNALVNYAFGLETPSGSQDTLLGTLPRRPHRVVGLLITEGQPVSIRYFTTAPKDRSPLLTGAVFRDANGNGRYDPGEGLGGVRIEVRGVPTTVSMDAGGYTLLLKKAGTVTVTASGGGLAAPLTQVVQVQRGVNTRVSFIS